MNLRNWSKGHTLGLLLGIATTIVCIPLVMFILSMVNNEAFSRLWFKFHVLHDWTSKIISLASIGGLIWFHFFLKREKWPYAMGIILATVINLFIILYFKFLA